jgi:hypothetical protein
MKKLVFFALLFSICFITNGQSFLSLSIKANKVLFDSRRNKLLAIVSGLDTQHGNKLIQINPNTGIVENSVFVGSEPSSMAFTFDSNYVYIGLDGASLVKRVNLNSFIVDRTISLGSGSSGALFADDVATIKSTPDIVVVARKYISISPRHAGVVAYKNTTKLNAETPTHTGSTIIETIHGTNFVVGFNTESTESGFRKMLVDTILGVQLISTTTGMPLSLQMEYENGFIYSNYGKVVDPNLSPPIVVGSFLGTVWDEVSVDINTKTNKVFFASTDYSRLELRAYNLQTYAFIKDTLVVGLYPNTFQLPEVKDLECYGNDGIAVIVSENYFNYRDRRLILFRPEIAIGVKENEPFENVVNVFPNPASNHINIESTKERLKEVIVINQLGSIVKSVNNNEINSLKKYIELDIPNGMYFVKIKLENKEVIQKLIIRN